MTGPEVPGGSSSPAPLPSQPRRWWTRPWTIVGILLAVVCIGIAGVVVLTSETTGVERDSGGGLAEPTSISVFDVQAGDCLERVESDSETRSLDGVPCSGRHLAEALSRFSLPAGDYPGDAAVFSAGDRRCARALEELVRPAERGGVETFYLSPTENSWETRDDREIVCIALSGEPRTGSVAR